MAFSAGSSPCYSAARCWNPQLLPACAQDRRYFAQVIHRLVHIKGVSVPVAGLAGGGAAQALATRPARQTRGSNPGAWTTASTPPQRSQSARLTGASPAPLMPQPVQTDQQPDAASQQTARCHRIPGQDRPRPVTPASVASRPRSMTCRRRGSLAGPPPTGTMTQATPSVTVTPARPRPGPALTARSSTAPGRALAAVGSPQLPK
jgi:hypothetical protein